MQTRLIVAALGVVLFLNPASANERGLASWYGPGFNGHRTACGQIYSEWGMTAAHPTLPCNTIVRVINLANMKQVDVRITDRGPFVRGRIIDLTHAAKNALGMGGTANVLIVPHK